MVLRKTRMAEWLNHALHFHKVGSKLVAKQLLAFRPAQGRGSRFGGPLVIGNVDGDVKWFVRCHQSYLSSAPAPIYGRIPDRPIAVNRHRHNTRRD